MRAWRPAVRQESYPNGRRLAVWTSVCVVLRNVLCLAALLLLTLPTAPDAQQFGGSRRVEVAPAYPYTAVGKWTYGDGGSRTVCTAFLVNNCTLVTARRCGQGKAGSFQFEASDGQRFQVRNVRADHGDKSEAKPEEPDLDVAFGQIAARTGQPPPGEKYGRFGFDDADTRGGKLGLHAALQLRLQPQRGGQGRPRHARSRRLRVGIAAPPVSRQGAQRRVLPAHGQRRLRRVGQPDLPLRAQLQRRQAARHRRERAQPASSASSSG